jgi:hypothetical protein
MQEVAARKLEEAVLIPLGRLISQSLHSLSRTIPLPQYRINRFSKSINL